MKGLGEWVAKIQKLESQSLLQILISFEKKPAREINPDFVCFDENIELPYEEGVS